MSRLILILAFVLPSIAAAETYPVRDSSGGQASAVCVGVMYDGGRANPRWIFLTNRHVVTHRGRTVKLWVGSDDGKWLRGESIRASEIKEHDVASFTVPRSAGEFRKVRLVEGVPDRSKVTVCGYSRQRAKFCLDGRLTGDIVTAGGRHAEQGDSGGSVLLKESGKSYLAGLTWAYGEDKSTHVVTAKACCEHLKWAYGAQPNAVQWHRQGNGCPNGRCTIHPQPPRPGIRYERIEPQMFSPPRIERYEEYPFPQTIPPPPEPTEPGPPAVPVSEIERAVERWMEKNSDKIRGPVGSSGQDGAAGDRGLAGQSGAAGLQGPSGGSVNDPRIADLIIRLELVEQQKRRVVIVDGKANKIIDDESYNPEEAIVLDIQRLIESAK